MSETNITEVWNEIRITSDGISISLFSESTDGGAVVEDETWFTFEEMEAMSPSAPINLNLSRESRQHLVEQSSIQSESEISDKPSAETMREYASPRPWDILRDENAPDWSEDEHVEVLEVLNDVSAKEYVVQGWNEGEVVEAGQRESDKTVADANPSYDEDEPVVIGRYVDGDGTEYAFPASRLTEE